MSIFYITNYKYDIEYELNFDSFNNFIQSIKESKKYYHDLCKKEEINIYDFDNQYIKNIDILQGELLKYFILITNDDRSEKYITITDDIRDFYNYMIEQLNFNIDCYIGMNSFNTTITLTSNMPPFEFNSCVYDNHTLVLEYARKININYLTKLDMNLLLNLYIVNYKWNSENSNINYLDKFKIEGYLLDDQSLKTKNKYLDSLDYETKYERELGKLLGNLYNICLTSIYNHDFPEVD